MSYVSTPTSKVADFSKFVLSVWVRVSKPALDARWAKYLTENSTFDPRNPAPLVDWNGRVPNDGAIIPAVTFGGPTSVPYILADSVQATWGTWRTAGGAPPDYTLTSYNIVQDGMMYTDPCFVGVGYNADYGMAGIVAKIQTNTTPVVTGRKQITGLSTDLATNTVYTTIDDYTSPSTPDFYWFGQPFTPVNDFVDKWHHVLISADLSNSTVVTSVGHGVEYTGVTGGARIWIAVDDVNYNGWDAFENYPGGPDLNLVLTEDALAVASSGPPPFNSPSVYAVDGFVRIVPDQVATPDHSDVPIVSTSGPGVISAFGRPFGLPASADLASHIFRCRLAEFQLYTGVSMDTSVEENRRCFITEKGAPVNAWSPAPQAQAAKAKKVLGKKPDLLLHGSKWWAGGISYGSPMQTLKAVGTINPVAGPKLGT